MIGLIELATGKLNDPILMAWAIDRYRQAGKGRSQRQKAMEHAWFDDLTLCRWLKSDDQETLNRLFARLPEERFANLGQAIGERWNKWGGNLAYHSAPILTRYQPDSAWRCFAEPPGGRHRDIESILGVIGSLSVLPREEGVQLLKAVAKRVLSSSEDSLTHELKLSDLVSVSLVLDRVVAPEVINDQLKEIRRGGDSNEYEVRHVAINPGSKDIDLMFADEFPCASCGHWVDFEFTSGAHLAISAELLKLTADSDKGLAGQSAHLSMAEALYNGQRLPVSEVVSRCKAAVAANPESIADRLRLGFCYRQVLSRPRYGLDCAERALDLEPNAVEAVVQKANAMAMQGDEAVAFQLLDQSLESKENWRFFSDGRGEPCPADSAVRQFI